MKAQAIPCKFARNGEAQTKTKFGIQALVLFSILYSLFSIPSFAQSPDQLLSTANSMYKDKKYDIAIEAYQKLISQGYKTTEVYYNLANAYYKTDQFSSAILFYERALRLSPSDEDSRFNLKLANQKIIDRITPVQQFFVISGWQKFVTSRSSRSWGVISVILVWLSFIAFALYLFVDSIKRTGFYSGLILLLFSSFFFYLAYSECHIESGTDEAILTATNTYVKSAPDAAGTDLFIIHEGIKMDILDRVGAWSKIRLADGKVGWVEQKNYTVI